MNAIFKIVRVILPIFFSLVIITTGKSFEENLHDRYFSDQASQQTVLKTDKNTDDKITILTENSANTEIQTFSNDKAIDNYKTPVGKQIWNILRVIVFIVFFSLLFWFIYAMMHIKSHDLHFTPFVFFIILFSVIVCVYNIFFLKYKFTVNNQYSIESMNYTDNTHRQIKIVGYDGNNYSTIECPTELLMVKKSDLTVLVKYNYKPKNILGVLLEWKAKTSEVNVLYLNDNYYSTNIDDIMDKFNENSDNIEDIKKDFASYVQNSNLKFLGDHCVSATFLKIVIIASIIFTIIMLLKKGKKVKKVAVLLIVAVIIVSIPVIIKIIKDPVYDYSVENTYQLVSISHDENKSDVYKFEYLIGDISETISVNRKDTQIIEMNSEDEANYIYKCKKKVATVFDWFAEGVSKSRIIYVLK